MTFPGLDQGPVKSARSRRAAKPRTERDRTPAGAVPETADATLAITVRLDARICPRPPGGAIGVDPLAAGQRRACLPGGDTAPRRDAVANPTCRGAQRALPEEPEPSWRRKDPDPPDCGLRRRRTAGDLDTGDLRERAAVDFPTENGEVPARAESGWFAGGWAAIGREDRGGEASRHARTGCASSRAARGATTGRRPAASRIATLSSGSDASIGAWRDPARQRSVAQCPPQAPIAGRDFESRAPRAVRELREAHGLRARRTGPGTSGSGAPAGSYRSRPGAWGKRGCDCRAGRTTCNRGNASPHRCKGPRLPRVRERTPASWSAIR